MSDFLRNGFFFSRFAEVDADQQGLRKSAIKVVKQLIKALGVRRRRYPQKHAIINGGVVEMKIKHLLEDKTIDEKTRQLAGELLQLMDEITVRVLGVRAALYPFMQEMSILYCPKNNDAVRDQAPHLDSLFKFPVFIFYATECRATATFSRYHNRRSLLSHSEKIRSGLTEAFFECEDHHFTSEDAAEGDLKCFAANGLHFGRAPTAGKERIVLFCSRQSKEFETHTSDDDVSVFGTMFVHWRTKQSMHLLTLDYLQRAMQKGYRPFAHFSDDFAMRLSLNENVLKKVESWPNDDKALFKRESKERLREIPRAVFSAFVARRKPAAPYPRSPKPPRLALVRPSRKRAAATSADLLFAALGRGDYDE